MQMFAGEQNNNIAVYGKKKTYNSVISKSIQESIISVKYSLAHS